MCDEAIFVRVGALGCISILSGAGKTEVPAYSKLDAKEGEPSMSRKLLAILAFNVYAFFLSKPLIKLVG